MVTVTVRLLGVTSLDSGIAVTHSPDAVFTGSTKCWSVTRVGVAREMNVGAQGLVDAAVRSEREGRPAGAG